MVTLHQHLAEIKRDYSNSLNGRTEAAAALALGGNVSLVEDGRWQVKSATEAAKVYTVKFEAGAWVCDCPDCQGTGYHPAPVVDFGGGVQRTCKHILAAAACYFAGEYPATPAYDLVIATKKTPFTTGSEDYKITWYKKAGADKVTPAGKNLADSDIQKALAKYRLVATEARQSEVIRRYTLVGAL